MMRTKEIKEHKTWLVIVLSSSQTNENIWWENPSVAPLSCKWKKIVGTPYVKGWINNQQLEPEILLFSS